ncbi:MAG: hypothetical protein ABW042_10850, partial [Phenylobacterium sp.]
MNTQERTVVERDATGAATRVHRETVVAGGPGEVQVIRESNTAAWWVAALVAIVAVLALFWLYSANRNNADDVQAAREAGRTEAMMDTAALQAQSAALAAQQSTQGVADSMARATEQAAANAAAASQAAADQAKASAQTAADAAHDAATA